jgi:hypothetical protein
MHDIFLSYAKEDRHYAQNIAKALEKEGYDVWWDVEIPTGKTFDRVIETAIDATKCVIVLWSKHSITSEWVHIEAAEGKDRNILIPVRIEDVEIPLAFSRRQTADLINWNNKTTEPLFKRLVYDIALIVHDGKTKEFKGAKKNEDERILREKNTMVAQTPSKVKIDQKWKTRYIIDKASGVLHIIAILDENNEVYLKLRKSYGFFDISTMFYVQNEYLKRFKRPRIRYNFPIEINGQEYFFNLLVLYSKIHEQNVLKIQLSIDDKIVLQYNNEKLTNR